MHIKENPLKLARRANDLTYKIRLYNGGNFILPEKDDKRTNKTTNNTPLSAINNCKMGFENYMNSNINNKIDYD